MTIQIFIIIFFFASILIGYKNQSLIESRKNKLKNTKSKKMTYSQALVGYNKVADKKVIKKQKVAEMAMKIEKPITKIKKTARVNSKKVVSAIANEDLSNKRVYVNKLNLIPSGQIVKVNFLKNKETVTLNFI